MRIIAIAIQKGGVGKTTTAAALAQAAVFRGRSCLAIDLDPQNQLRYPLGAPGRKGNSYELLQGNKMISKVIQTTKTGADMITADRGLSTLKSGPGSARRLQAALEPVQDKYDYVVMDTPPTAGELQYNALQAATDLIIPLQADLFSMQSLYDMVDTARQIQQSNKALKLTGFIFTAYDGRSLLARQMKGTIIDKAEALGVPYLGTIRAAVAIREAQALQKSLYEYAPKSKPAQDYLQLFDKIDLQGN